MTTLCTDGVVTKTRIEEQGMQHEKLRLQLENRRLLGEIARSEGLAKSMKKRARIAVRRARVYSGLLRGMS